MLDDILSFILYILLHVIMQWVLLFPILALVYTPYIFYKAFTRESDYVKNVGHGYKLFYKAFKNNFSDGMFI